MRLMECMLPRTKDADFGREAIIVRDAESSNDRVVRLLHSPVPALRLRWLAARGPLGLMEWRSATAWKLWMRWK